jgi:hypothetical protein
VVQDFLVWARRNVFGERQIKEWVRGLGRIHLRAGELRCWFSPWSRLNTRGQRGHL